MEKTNQKPCPCVKASCGCGEAKNERCGCGEGCDCGRPCDCASGCGCQASK